MAGDHALMSTLFLYLEASFSTAVGFKLFQTGEAFAGWVTDLFAPMATGQFSFAYLTAVRNTLVTENIRHELPTTVAKPGHLFEAGRAVTRMTLHGTGMATCEFFLTGSPTGRLRNSTLDGRVELGNITRTEERLS